MHTKYNRIFWLFLVLLLLVLILATPAAAGPADTADEPAPPPPGETVVTAEAESTVAYTVRADDTLWDIATAHNTSVERIIDANPGIDPKLLQAGQVLMVPAPAGAQGVAAPAAAPPAAEATPAVHTIRPDDTLWDIATAYGVSVEAIMGANPGIDPKRLIAGQTLVIPNGNAAGAPPAPVVESVVHTVALDDTMWDIASRYGVSVDTILAANPGVDPKRLIAGQTLVIPGGKLPPPPVEPAPPAPPPPAEATPAEAAPADAPPAVDPPPADPPPPADAPPEEAPPAEAPPPEAPPAEPPPPAAAPALPPEIADWPVLVLNQINEQRAARGLAQLAWNNELAAAAQAHAEDLARRNKGGHVGSDGARLGARLARVGYNPHASTENWANARSPQQCFAMWFNEAPGRDPHRRAILGRAYTEIGIGVAKGAWGYYFIADFGAR